MMTLDARLLLIMLALPLLAASWQLPSAIVRASGPLSNRSGGPSTAAAALRGRPSAAAAAAVDHDDGSSPFGSSRLLHAMLRVADRDAAVAFWEGRGAQVISPDGPGAKFVGFGAYRDTEHFALELAQVSPDSTTKLVNSAVSYIGLSMLLPQQPPDAEDTDIPDDPLARFLAARAAKPWSMQDASGAVDALRGAEGLEVKSVASAPGDPLAQFSLRTSSVEMLAATASFYSDVLCMSEVGAPSETQRCFRYGALPGGALEGVPVTLVFRVEDGLVGDPASTQECFDHIAISCVDVDAASAHINGNEGGEAPLAPVILEPCDMFGTRIMGVSDPNGYKVYLVEEAGFRSG